MVQCNSCLKEDLPTEDRWMVKKWAEAGFDIILCTECMSIFRVEMAQERILNLFKHIKDYPYEETT